MSKSTFPSTRITVICTYPTSTNGRIFPSMRLVLLSGVTMSCSRVPRSRSRTIAMLVMSRSVSERSTPMIPGTMYASVRIAGLYQGRTRTSSGGARPVRPAAISAPRAAPASDAPAMAADEAIGSAASTMICACAVRPRLMSRWNSGGMITAAFAAPDANRRVSSARLSTEPTMSKLPVLRMTAISDRLSALRDSSSTTVGRWRTSVRIANPNSASCTAGMPTIIPSVSRSRRIWMNSFRSIGHRRHSAMRSRALIPRRRHRDAEAR
jgi:hypothetical protein